VPLRRAATASSMIGARLPGSPPRGAQRIGARLCATRTRQPGLLKSDSVFREGTGGAPRTEVAWSASARILSWPGGFGATYAGMTCPEHVEGSGDSPRAKQRPQGGA
jgi:hypothetical protein